MTTASRILGVAMLAALVLGSALVPAAGAAQEDPLPEPDCSTPRAAAITWLGNLQEDRARPDAAVQCFDWAGADVPADKREEYARHLKEVLDVGGHWVEVDELPAETTVEGRDRIPLFETKFPDVYFVKRDGRWVLSANSIRRIPALYDEAITVDVQSFIDSLPPWLQEEAFFEVQWWQLVGLLLSILLGLMVRALVSWLVATYGARLIAKQGQSADDNIIAQAARPIGTIAMAGVFWYLLPILRFSARVNQVAGAAIRVIAAVGVVLLLYRVVDLLSDIFARRAEKTETKLDDQLVPLVRRTLKVFVVVVGVIFVLQNMDVDVTSLLAVGTVGTLAFSFAAQDTVSNLFGSVSIFADRPFQIGDWVVIGDTEGIVEEVGMRSTRIRTFYNSLITLPNSLITKTPVDNYGARRFRRTSTSVGLTYDTTPEQMQAFCEGVRAILRANPHVRKDAYEVHFKGFGASSLDVMLYFFFETNSWSVELSERHNIFLEVMRLARELKVQFAFPTQTLHLATITETQPVEERVVLEEDAMRKKVLAFAPGGEMSRPAGPRITDDGFVPVVSHDKGNEAAEG